MNWKRKLVQISSLLAFIFLPFLISFSPMTLLTKKLLLPPLILILATLIFSRAFCGWICPLGTIIEFLDNFSFNFKLPVSKDFRFYFLIFLVSSSILSLPIFWFFSPLTVFKRLVTNIKTREFFFLSFFLILVLEIFFGERTCCKKICPLGAFLSLISKFGLLEKRINEKCIKCGKCVENCPMDAIENFKIKKEDCILCGKCEENCPMDAIETGFNIKKKKKEVDLGKRQLLKAGGAAILPFLIPFRFKGKKKEIRPPGALREEEFLKRCIRCGNCVFACPENLIKFKKEPEEDFLTPYIDHGEGYCTGCMKCVKACPVSALKEIKEEEMKLGTAKIDKGECMVWAQEKPCLICYRECPYDAIRLKDGKPVVIEDKCKGCGKCQFLCPRGAIEVKKKGEKRWS